MHRVTAEAFLQNFLEVDATEFTENHEELFPCYMYMLHVHVTCSNEWVMKQ